MAAHYDSIAQKYKKFKESPFCLHVETYTYLNFIGDISGKSILDLACGEGFYTRKLKQKGAARIVGVDISEKMIELARLSEEKEPLGIEYIVSDAQQIGTIGSFDLVVASYLLNYAQTKDQLLKMCQSIAANLKPGGRFVSINNNPELPAEFYAQPKSEKYGVVTSINAPLQEGSSINLKLKIPGTSDQVSIDIYYFSRATYEWAFQSVGFKEIRWHQPIVSPEGVQEFGLEFWQDFIDYPSIVCIQCLN
jgi:ubiquinone/menaquinone biosynthesis C-methylase UbiE